MKVRYDQKADVLRIMLNVEPIEDSDEKRGNVVASEILDASTRISDPKAPDYAVSG